MESSSSSWPFRGLWTVSTPDWGPVDVVPSRRPARTSAARRPRSGRPAPPCTALWPPCAVARQTPRACRQWAGPAPRGFPSRGAKWRGEAHTCLMPVLCPRSEQRLMRAAFGTSWSLFRRPTPSRAPASDSVTACFTRTWMRGAWLTWGRRGGGAFGARCVTLHAEQSQALAPLVVPPPTARAML